MADEIARGKEYVEAIFNSVTDSIFVTDLKRLLVTCNRATERIFGYAREEMIGRSARIFYPSESSFRSAGRKYLAKIREQGYEQGEVVLKRKDGSTFLSYASATLLADTEGKPTGLVVVVRDISKRGDARR
jgi:PAS domain S-box-containing protein